MVRFDSYRAASAGNWASRNLVTKSTIGGRATWQAVMRVKFEQASKAAMWTPTRRMSGEGRADREEPGAGARQLNNHNAPIRTTGGVSTACEEVMSSTFTGSCGANARVRIWQAPTSRAPI